MLTQQKLKEFLNYNPDTGVFIWKIYRGSANAGDVAGCIDIHGYIIIGIKGISYKAHRLAFLYMTGRWPVEIDHINRVKDDNRWCNLREANRSINNQNRCDNVNVIYEGETLCITEACRRKGVSYMTIVKRMNLTNCTATEALMIGKTNGRNGAFVKALKEYREGN